MPDRPCISRILIIPCIAFLLVLVAAPAGVASNSSDAETSPATEARGAHRGIDEGKGSAGAPPDTGPNESDAGSPPPQANTSDTRGSSAHDVNADAASASNRGSVKLKP